MVWRIRDKCQIMSGGVMTLIYTVGSSSSIVSVVVVVVGVIVSGEFRFFFKPKKESLFVCMSESA